MGLDMYLMAKKSLPGAWSHGEDNEKAAFVEILGAIDTPPELVMPGNGPAHVDFCCCYWRKANAIHAWFVKHVQEGVDECKEHYVEKEKLQELYNLCQRVLADMDKAPELLPTQSGFFFGGTEYNEDYRDDLKHTMARLEVCLSPKCDGWDFYYHSSW